MAITEIQTATAGSVANLVPVVKAHIAASRFPNGGLIGVHATPTKTEYFQVVAFGGTAATDYDIVVSTDRADFTIMQRKDCCRIPSDRRHERYPVNSWPYG